MPKRASVSRIAGSTVPRSSPTTTTLIPHALQRQDADEVQRSFAHVRALGRVRRRRESRTGGRGASRDRCAARRRAGSSCGSIRRTAGSRPRDAAPSSAAESAQSWPFGEKSSGGEPTRQPATIELAGAPTGRCRSGRSPAPDRDRARSTGRRSRAYCCAGRQLQVDLPLQVLIEHDAAPVLLAEGARFRRTGILIALRPLGPQPEVGIAPVQMLVERAVGGEVLEQVALAAREGLELARPRRPVRHSRRNSTNGSLRKRSLSALTRSYSTNGDCAQSLDLRDHRRRFAQALRAPRPLRNPPCLRRPGRGSSGRRCSSAGTDWC